MVRLVMEMGLMAVESARKALQMIPVFAVARTRAEPAVLNSGAMLRLESGLKPAAPSVAKSAVWPGSSVSDESEGVVGALSDAPFEPKTSTPTMRGLDATLVHAKNVLRWSLMTPGTVQTWYAGSPWSGAGGLVICAAAFGATDRTAASTNTNMATNFL